jgi:hypothetical protein
MNSTVRGFSLFCTAHLLALCLCKAQATVPAQPTPESCDVRVAKEKVRWSKTPHMWLSNVFHKQKIETGQTWCLIGEAKGYDRVHKIEDFGRVVFTGEGLHPALGNIVPGSGLAGGLALNLARNVTSPPIHFSGNVEARGSINAFWIAGGQLNLLGSSDTVNDEHIHATFFAKHYSLPQLTYFGLGNSSMLANESLYGLQSTTVGANLGIPLPRGLEFLAVSEGLWASPAGLHGSTTPSIEQTFTPTNTPALNSPTTYVVYGAGVGWKYPIAERLYSYRTSVDGLFRIFHETTGAPYSFRRLDASWTQRYTPRLSVDLGSFSVVSRLVESIAPGGNNVPFYLQPTLGGTDIENWSDLRSYRDYRFRAPNALSFQAQYERAVKDPLGVLFFYDVGKVALARSDIDISHMRHSFGIGGTLRAGASTVLGLYYAWGGNEGTHTTLLGNTNALGANSGLNGVF